MEQHYIAVAAISAQVRSFYDRKEPFRIYHGHTNSTRPLAFKRDQIVNTSKLNHIVRVDRLKRTALVEPNVSMQELVSATIHSNLVPKVVMEFKSITVGGGFAGTSGESSSFKHGFFEDTVSKIEIVLANGEVTTASRTHNSDLLDAAAGSFGTFGVVTLLEIELQPAHRYVKLECLPIQNRDQAITEIEKATGNLNENDYVDGILFSQGLGVVMVGRFANGVANDIPVATFTHAWDEWFYTYVEQQLSKDTTSPFSIAIPLVDYLFRYERGAFWTGKFAYDYFCVPFNRWTRYLLNPFMKTTVMYHAMHESGLANQYIAQDIGFPSSKVGSFVEYIDSNFGIYPIWLCPLRKGHRLPLHARTGTTEGDEALKTESLINVGVWGRGPRRPLEFIKANREIEQKTRELWGGKCLYARVYYTEEEFWRVYNQKWYDTLREKYHATTLPNVYDKTKTEIDLKALTVDAPSSSTVLQSLVSALWDIWPVAGLYGVFAVILGVFIPAWKEYIIKS